MVDAFELLIFWVVLNYYETLSTIVLAKIGIQADRHWVEWLHKRSIVCTLANEISISILWHQTLASLFSRFITLNNTGTQLRVVLYRLLHLAWFNDWISMGALVTVETDVSSQSNLGKLFWYDWAVNRLHIWVYRTRNTSTITGVTSLRIIWSRRIQSFGTVDITLVGISYISLQTNASLNTFPPVWSNHATALLPCTFCFHDVVIGITCNKGSMNCCGSTYW